MPHTTESPCPALTPLATQLRTQVAAYKETLTRFEAEGTAELAQTLARIQADIEETEGHIREVLEPLGYSLDTLNPIIEINRMLKKLEFSRAELDPDFEGGIVHLEIDARTWEALKTWDTARQAYEDLERNADGSSNADIWEEIPESSWATNWQPPIKQSFDVLVVGQGDREINEGERYEVVSCMDTMGYRPLTFSELLAVGIVRPHFQKMNTLTTCIKGTVKGRTFMPSLVQNDDKREIFMFSYHSGLLSGRLVFTQK